MKTKLFGIFVFLLISLFGNKASAFLSSGSIPLPKTIEKAQVVVVAKILTQKPNLSDANDPNRNIFQFYPPGQYTLQILQTIKGRLPSKIQINLPELSAISYGETEFTISKGSRVLLFLQTSSNGDWVPVDNAMPLIKLADTQALGIDDSIGVLSRVVNILLASLPDPTLRTANLTAMKDVVAPQIVAGMVPYLNDQDANEQAAVLDCLATNQQVSIIPRLVELAMQAEKRSPGTGGSMTRALEKFTTPEAIPYLNPLVLTPNYGVRRNATYALYKIADKTSIPYLILALHDPDSTLNIPAAANVALHRIVPALGPRILQSHDDYVKHRQEQTKPINKWWSDELEGQHLTQDEKTALAAQSALPQTADQLQVMLWRPFVDVRRRAMDALMPLADQTTIPYLVLALQDPDIQVAYGAYKTLHRLIATLGDAVGSEAFAARRDQESQPLYDWWSDHLREKPIPIPSSKGFIPLPNGK